MSYAPWIPKNHLEVLAGHPDRNKTSLPRKLYYPGVGGLFFLMGSLLHNIVNRRPLIAGLPFHAAAIVGGVTFGSCIAKGKEWWFRENEARLRYYIETHREEFPDYEMVKVGEILEPWIPVRG